MADLPVDPALREILKNPNASELFNNITHLMNSTGNFHDFNNINVKTELIEQFKRNRRLDDPAFYSFICIYCVLILVGAVGNSLVVCAVARKPAMRTARNMFILNLAISDLLLCLITMPLTLAEIVTKYWPFGNTAFLCKMVGSLQATSIFVSTISITAIALDRYQVIVYPTKESLQIVGAVMILSLIWIVSFLLALPLAIWRELNHHDMGLASIGVKEIDFCIEQWPTNHGRALYSIFSIVVQYVLPIMTVTIAYARICKKLQYRMANSAVGKNCNKKQQKEDRVKKTNTLLISIALIFCISWLPLNIYNVIFDLVNPFEDNPQLVFIIYAICHMMGMSSACSNPWLYGWLNDNFRKEFKEIFAIICWCCPQTRAVEKRNSYRSSVTRGKTTKSTSGKTEKHPVAVFHKGSDRLSENGMLLNMDESESTLVTHLVVTATDQV